MPSKFKKLSINDTGFVDIPAGTTAQRQTLTETVEEFTSVGSTSWTVPAGVTKVEVLVVAGGGAGGYATTNQTGPGGGGAGGLIYDPAYSVTPGQSISVVVGAGGTGAIAGGQADNGDNSQFGELIAIGGGGGGAGGNGTPPTADGAAGGSGGGGGAAGTAEERRYGGAGTPGQGHSGGDAGWDSANLSTGGGGGGAGTPGEPGMDGVQQGDLANATRGGNGGQGLEFSISGTPKYYAGGGGGGMYFQEAQCVSGTGGVGGGGNGGAGSQGGNTGYNGTAGQANTGGGGGAGGQGNTPPNGGSGVVIVRYVTDSDAEDPNGQLRYNTTTGQLELIERNDFSKLIDSNIVRDGLAIYLDPQAGASGTSVPDLSGRGNDGELVDGATINSNGHFQFRGDGTNDCIRVTDPVGLTNLSAKNQYTMECWFYETAHTDYSGLVAFTSDPTGQEYHARLMVNGSNSRPFYDVFSNDRAIPTGSGIEIGRWYHIAISVKAGNSVKIYLNGNLRWEENTRAPKLPSDNGSTLLDLGIVYFGTGERPDTHALEGYMGPSRVYERALTQDEIQQNFNAERSRFTSIGYADKELGIVKEGLHFWVDAADPRSFPRIRSEQNYDTVAERDNQIWYDMAGGHHGRLIGGAEWTAQAGGAIGFDGSNSYVLWNHYDWPAGDSARSYSLWTYLNSSSTGTRQLLFGVGLFGTNNSNFDIEANSYQSGVSDGYGIHWWGNGRKFSGASETRYNQWVHITVTHGGENLDQYTKLYLNGDFIGDLAAISQTFSTSSINFAGSGYRAPLSDLPVDGYIGEIQGYTRELDPHEVRQNFEATRGRYGV